MMGGVILEQVQQFLDERQLRGFVNPKGGKLHVGLLDNPLMLPYCKVGRRQVAVLVPPGPSDLCRRPLCGACLRMHREHMRRGYAPRPPTCG